MSMSTMSMSKGFEKVVQELHGMLEMMIRLLSIGEVMVDIEVVVDE